MGWRSWAALGLWVSATSVAAPLKRDPRIEPGVSWSDAVVRATGSGPPDLSAPNGDGARRGAERAAKADASRGLLAEVKNLQVRAGTTIRSELESEELRGRLKDALSSFKMVSKRYYADGGLEIDVELPLAALTALWVEPMTTAPPEPAGKSAAVSASGVVVDARGVKVKPVLIPRLLDEAGNVLYEATMLSDEARRTVPVASWVKSMDEGKKSMKIGERPLVVKAKRVKGSDLILSAADGKRLADSGGRYLTEGRVVIVLP